MTKSFDLAVQAVRNMVVEVDGKLITNSRWIGEVFGKQHKDVLKAFDNLECSEDFNRRNFAPISYLDAMNREQRQIEMSFEGFMFLVTGFTGSVAARFKEAFIAEFMRMRRDLEKRYENEQIKALEQKAAHLERYARFPTEPLTDERRASVVQMLSDGYSIADAARLNRVSQQTVRILRDANLPAAVNKNQGRLDLEGGAA